MRVFRHYRRKAPTDPSAVTASPLIITMTQITVALDKLLLLGDSIISFSNDPNLGFGLTPALQNYYSRRLQVINRGFSGYNSSWARALIDPILSEENAGHAKVKLAVIFYGSNDSATNDIQHVPIDKYRDNLRYIASRALEAGAQVILVGPAPLNETNTEFLEDRTTESMKNYGQAAGEIAKELGVGFVDLWHAFIRSTGWKEGEPHPGKLDQQSKYSLDDYFTDGLHYTGKGYKVFYDELKAEIKAKYPQLSPEALPRLLPEWQDWKSTYPSLS
uniref:ARAD1C44242p n=1 Tax=Blastobotrys adeninivorans TaxID=409370 RepID=A0A060TAA6_BLAAD